MRSAVFVLFLLVTTPGFAASRGSLPVTVRTLAYKDAVVAIRAEYPQTGDAQIDKDIFSTVNAIAGDFRKVAAASHEDKDPPFTLDLGFKVARNDSAMFDVVFSDEWDLHGAHPNLEFVTANYFRSEGWRVYLPEYLDGERGLKRLSKLAIADLERRLLGPNGITDKDWIRRGAAPQWSNFAAFVIRPDALEIEYPPYQVASYADGPQVSRLPLAGLRDVVRANPRLPIPSFDCAKARSGNEKMICSDVMLARLDRAVSETWSSELANENDPGRKAKLKTSQTAWLNGRDRTCAGVSRVACLVAYYRARLAALENER